MHTGWRVLTDRGRALVAAGLTLSASGLVLGFVDLTRVGILVLSLPFLCAWTLGLTRSRLAVRRIGAPADPQVGSTLEVTLEITNTSRSALLASTAEEHLDPALGRRPHLLVPRLRPAGQARLHYRLHPIRRGLHRIGPLSLRRRDPFGLAASTVTVPGDLEVLVLPQICPLSAERSEVAGAGAQGSGRQVSGSSGIDDAVLRGYQLGDDLRRVHWPVSAHRGQLMVRHEGRPTSRRAVLVIDPELGGPGPSGRRRQPCRALDWGVEALSAVAAHLDTAGYALYLATAQDVVPSVVDRVNDTAASGSEPPGDRDRLELDRTLHALATIEPASTSTEGSPNEAPSAALESPLVTHARELTAGGGLLVMAVGDANPAVARSLLDIRPSAMTAMVFVLATDTFADAPPPRATRATQADDLAGLAWAGGWRATVVDSTTGIDTAWTAVTTGAAGPP